MLKVNTVCVNGMGSSLILRISVEKALSQLQIAARVEAVDLGGFKGLKPDLVVTTPALAKKIEPREGMKVVSIVNFTDVGKIREALEQALKGET